MIFGAGTLALGGNRIFDIGSQSTEMSGLAVSTVISGGGSISKLGTGALRLDFANIYSGGTVVSAGGLVASNTTGSGVGTGALVIQSGAFLRGTGIVGGATTIEAGGILGAGDFAGNLSITAGNLTFTNGLTLNDGAIFKFKLGTASDKISLIGGVLTGAATPGSLTINLDAGTGFSAGTYTLFDFSSGGTTTSSFDVADFTLGTTISGYSYNLALNGGSSMLQLTASAIPEPSTYAAIFGALALSAAGWHRRRVRATRPN
jgi:autotransporter-associated beta strand protein